MLQGTLCAMRAASYYAARCTLCHMLCGTGAQNGLGETNLEGLQAPSVIGGALALCCATTVCCVLCCMLYYALCRVLYGVLHTAHVVGLVG